MARTIRMLIALTAAAVVVSLAGSSAAFASGASFASASSAVADNGALVATFDEQGLGASAVDYLLTADSTASYACSNHLADPHSVSGQVSDTASFTPSGGHVTASLSAGPLAAGFSCSGNHTLVLISVSYTNVVLADTTNSVSAALPNVFRVFVV